MLSVLLNSLVGFYLLRDSASMPCIPWTEGQGGIPVEAWVHLKGQEVPESITHGLKPEWHIATAEEVSGACIDGVSDTSGPRATCLLFVLQHCLILKASCSSNYM